MTDEPRKPTVEELWKSARVGMIWRNKPVEDRLDKFSTARLWMKEEDITQGVIPVKASAIHDNYVKWCKERQINKSKLDLNKFGSFLKDNFRSVKKSDGAKRYYINKELNEDPQAKEERKKKHGRPQKTKKEVSET